LLLDLDYIKRTILTQQQQMEDAVTQTGQSEINSLNIILCHQQILDKISTWNV